MATFPGNPSMAQRIARVLPALTRAHRHMAEYVLAHPLQAATMPIDELAATVGVSVATANRFARALEFDGYPQFRAALVLGFEATLAPVERLRTKLEQRASAAGVMAAALDEAAGNIELTRHALEARSCEQAVNAIAAAHRVYIVGFGSSAWLGGLLQRYLDRIRDDVHLVASIEGSSNGARIIARLTRTDLVIAIGFPRYFSDTVLLAQRAFEAGVPVLALTDRVTSPLCGVATMSLLAHGASQYFANSEASALALIEALCSAVAHRNKDSVRNATLLSESVLPWLHGTHPGRLRPVPAAATPVKRRLRTSPRTTKATK